MTDVVEEIDLTAREELHRLYERDGKLTAESTVSEASDPISPLHQYFEWDDLQAAHEHRLSQARYLIRRFEIVIDERPVREFVYVPSEGSFTPLRGAMRNRNWREEILAKFERDAEAFEARWANHKWVADHYKEWIRRKAG